MSESGWFKDLHDEFSKDFEYQLYGVKLDITESICQIMEEKKISRSQLAESMGTSPSAITKMLNGNSNFTLKRLLKLSICLDHDLTVSFKPKSVQETTPTLFADKTEGFWENLEKTAEIIKKSQFQTSDPCSYRSFIDANSVIPCFGTGYTT